MKSYHCILFTAFAIEVHSYGFNFNSQASRSHSGSAASAEEGSLTVHEGPAYSSSSSFSKSKSSSYSSSSSGSYSFQGSGTVPLLENAVTVGGLQDATAGGLVISGIDSNHETGILNAADTIKRGQGAHTHGGIKSNACKVCSIIVGDNDQNKHQGNLKHTGSAHIYPGQVTSGAINAAGITHSSEYDGGYYEHLPLNGEGKHPSNLYPVHTAISGAVSIAGTSQNNKYDEQPVIINVPNTDIDVSQGDNYGGGYFEHSKVNGDRKQSKHPHHVHSTLSGSIHVADVAQNNKYDEDYVENSKSKNNLPADISVLSPINTVQNSKFKGDRKQQGNVHSGSSITKEDINVEDNSNNGKYNEGYFENSKLHQPGQIYTVQSSISGADNTADISKGGEEAAQVSELNVNSKQPENLYLAQSPISGGINVVGDSQDTGYYGHAQIGDSQPGYIQPVYSISGAISSAGIAQNSNTNGYRKQSEYLHPSHTTTGEGVHISDVSHNKYDTGYYENSKVRPGIVHPVHSSDATAVISQNSKNDDDSEQPGQVYPGQTITEGDVHVSSVSQSDKYNKDHYGNSKVVNNRPGIIHPIHSISDATAVISQNSKTDYDSEQPGQVYPSQTIIGGGIGVSSVSQSDKGHYEHSKLEENQQGNTHPVLTGTTIGISHNSKAGDNKHSGYGYHGQTTTGGDSHVSDVSQSGEYDTGYYENTKAEDSQSGNAHPVYSISGVTAVVSQNSKPGYVHDEDSFDNSKLSDDQLVVQQPIHSTISETISVAGNSQTDKYNQGFNGPPGILNPYDIIIPNKQHETNAPSHQTHHNYEANIAGATITTGLVHNQQNFGGPPGVLTPYDIVVPAAQTEQNDYSSEIPQYIIIDDSQNKIPPSFHGPPGVLSPHDVIIPANHVKPISSQDLIPHNPNDWTETEKTPSKGFDGPPEILTLHDVIVPAYQSNPHKHDKPENHGHKPSTFQKPALIVPQPLPVSPNSDKPLNSGDFVIVSGQTPILKPNQSNEEDYWEKNENTNENTEHNYDYEENSSKDQKQSSYLKPVNNRNPSTSGIQTTVIYTPANDQYENKQTSSNHNGGAAVASGVYSVNIKENHQKPQKIPIHWIPGNVHIAAENSGIRKDTSAQSSEYSQEDNVSSLTSITNNRPCNGNCREGEISRPSHLDTTNPAWIPQDVHNNHYKHPEHTVKCNGNCGKPSNSPKPVTVVISSTDDDVKPERSHTHYKQGCKVCRGNSQLSNSGSYGIASVGSYAYSPVLYYQIDGPDISEVPTPIAGEDIGVNLLHKIYGGLSSAGSVSSSGSATYGAAGSLSASGSRTFSASSAGSAAEYGSRSYSGGYAAGGY